MSDTVSPSSAEQFLDKIGDEIIESPWTFVILLVGNFALAFGPLLVRLADSGPTASAFWRMSLALPLLFYFAWRWGRLREFTSAIRQSFVDARQATLRTDSNTPIDSIDSAVAAAPSRKKRWRRGAWPKSPHMLALLLAILAGILFALDLASWHIGIVQTKLANASLFGNSASLFLVVISIIVARRLPPPAQIAGIALAFPGAILLLAQSYEMSRQYFIGDLFCLLAGVFYCSYLIVIKRAQRWLDNWSALFICVLAGAPVLLGIAVLLDEKVIPSDWTPVVALAVSSQMIGQGCMVYALSRISTIIVGLSLLAQPAIAAVLGWVLYDEYLSYIDWIGGSMVAAALVLTRLPERRKKRRSNASIAET